MYRSTPQIDARSAGDALQFGQLAVVAPAGNGLHDAIIIKPRVAVWMCVGEGVVLAVHADTSMRKEPSMD